MNNNINNNMQVASERTDSINDKLYVRNIPSQPLQPYFSSTPQSTKFSYMPMIDYPVSKNTPLHTYNIYSPSSVFYGGNSTAPWSGFVGQVDTESELRNQTYSLQHDSLGAYIPPSTSNLYKFSWENNKSSNTEKDMLDKSDLFNQQTFASFNPNVYSDDVGYSLFNNSTRQQNKNVKM